MRSESESLEQRLIRVVGSSGVFRSQDVDQQGISRTALQRLYGQGIIERVGRGLYRMAIGDISEHQSLIEASQRLPRSVVCLLSALRFHEMTTQSPSAVWLAIDRKAWLSKADGPPVHVVRFSGQALTEGIEVHILGNTEVRIYSPAKTVADCFKYRNKIGLDVALEALRDGVEKKHASFDELWKYAKICRVANVMRPYLESLG
jgi:predicted transcriptional regulator of viral defense system